MELSANKHAPDTVKRGNTKVLGEERGGSGGAAEGRARRRRRNGEWATRRWRRGGAADDGATWRQNVVGRDRGNDPRRGAAGKNPAAASNGGAGPDGRPEAGCGQQKSSGQHPTGTIKPFKRGRERKAKMAQAANETNQTKGP